MNIVQEIRIFIERHQLASAHSTIIVGLSGGPDSVALVHILHILSREYQYTLIAAHLNHGWRSTAHEDEAACKKIAEQLAIPFIAGHASQFQHIIKNTGSQEDCGRRMRRAFFKQIAQQYSAAHSPVYIALGHHLNDQHETFFIRLIRGAGLTGLVGIRPIDGRSTNDTSTDGSTGATSTNDTPANGSYVRPLLTCTKQEILDYLALHNLAYCTDHTNSDPRHLRNRIRHQLLPALAQCDERSAHSLTTTMHNLAQADDFITQHTAHVFQRITTQYESHTALIIKDFLSEHTYMQKQLLMKLMCNAKAPFTPSTGLLEELQRFISQPESAIHTLYNSWQLHKKQGLLFLTITQ